MIQNMLGKGIRLCAIAGPSLGHFVDPSLLGMMLPLGCLLTLGMLGSDQECVNVNWGSVEEMGSQAVFANMSHFKHEEFCIGIP